MGWGPVVEPDVATRPTLPNEMAYASRLLRKHPPLEKRVGCGVLKIPRCTWYFRDGPDVSVSNFGSAVTPSRNIFESPNWGSPVAIFRRRIIQHMRMILPPRRTASEM